MLVEGNFDAVDFWGDRLDDIHGLISVSELNKISTALENFEFDTALSVLIQNMEKHK
jgi:hypothetical protein